MSLPGRSSFRIGRAATSSPGDRSRSRHQVRSSWRQRVHHRPERTARERGRRGMPSAGPRGRRRENVPIHQGRPLVRTLTASPRSTTTFSLWLTSPPRVRETRRSVSEVRRVAEELQAKTGSNGVDFLVTTQGQSVRDCAPLDLLRRTGRRPAHLQRAAQVVPRTASTSRRPRRRRTTRTLPCRPCPGSASRTSLRRPGRSRTRGSLCVPPRARTVRNRTSGTSSWKGRSTGTSGCSGACSGRRSRIRRSGTRSRWLSLGSLSRGPTGQILRGLRSSAAQFSRLGWS